MQVPPELARDAELLEVTDRTNVSGGLFDEGFLFGPYAVTDVHRLQNSRDQFAVALAGGDDAGGYEYLVSHRGMALKAGCRSSERAKRLACACASADATTTLSMQDVAGTFEGTIATSAGRYRVTSVHELEGGSNQNEPSGYRIDASGLLGVVDVTAPGRAWLRKTLGDAEQSQLVCLFVGLLLYEPPEVGTQ
jgi:hypothetical protein